MDTTEADAHDRAGMERLIAGHDVALNDLMERHATPGFQFLCRMLGNEDDANDLTQETFVRISRARAGFRLDQKFSTWCYTICCCANTSIPWSCGTCVPMPARWEF